MSKNAQNIIVRDDQTKALAVSMIYNLLLSQEHEVTIKPYKAGPKQRTLKMNAALHKWLTMYATAMNEAGFTQRELIGKFKDGFELPVTDVMLKDIFREVGKAMYKKDSTAKLDTKEMKEVHRVVEQRLSEITGVFVPWPSNTPPPY